MLFKNKKGIELTFTTVIVAIVLIVVMTVVLLFFGKFFGLEVGILTPTITGLQCDTDSDGIKDSIDTCPCDKNLEANLPCSIVCKEGELGKPCKENQQTAQSKK